MGRKTKDGVVKATQICVRAHMHQEKSWRMAAASRSLDLPDWVRETLDRAARSDGSATE